jgi:U3 small nucleolar RNA-associated protein 21
VCVSACGNFVFLGTASGVIDMFNLQSGIFKKTFKNQGNYDFMTCQLRIWVVIDVVFFLGHEKPIVGLAADSTTTKLISASLDSSIKVK